MERRIDVRGLIADDVYGDAGRQARRDPLERGLGRLDHRDRVGAGLTAHFEHDGRHAVQSREGALFLGAVLGAADVADADRRAVARGHDQVVELAGIAEAPDGAQRALVDVGRDVAAGQVRVLLLQRIADFGDRQLVGGEAVGLDPDAHRPLEPADDLHFANAGRALERHLDDLVRDLGELANRQLARQGNRQDRIAIGILLHDYRRLDVVGQPAQRRRDAIAHVLRGDVDVAIEVERHVEHRLSGRRDRPELADAFHAVDDFFEHVGDLGLDFLDRSAGQGGPDHHVWQVHRREPIDAQPHERRAANHHERHDDHRREDGAADADGGEGAHAIR